MNFGNNPVFHSALTNHQVKDTYTPSSQNTNNDGISLKSKILIGLGVVAAGVAAFCYFRKGKVKNVIPPNTPAPKPHVQNTNVPAQPPTPKVRQMSEKGLENLKKHIVFQDKVVYENNRCYKDGKLFTGKVFDSDHHRITRYKDGRGCATFRLDTKNEVITEVYKKFTYPKGVVATMPKVISSPIKLDVKSLEAM